MFAHTRYEGVTTAIVTPRGGLISGQAAVIDLASGHTSDMIRRAPVVMVAQIDSPNDAGTGSRGELMGKLRVLLDDVKFYSAHQTDYDHGTARSLSATRADLEALLPVVAGKLPLILEANRMDEIDAAVTLAHDYSLKLIFFGGAEAWLAADRLASALKPVLTGPLDSIPTRL